jgi:hypothetical protein
MDKNGLPDWWGSSEFTGEDDELRPQTEGDWNPEIRALLEQDHSTLSEQDHRTLLPADYWSMRIRERRTSGVEAGRPPQPDFLTAMTSGVEAGPQPEDDWIRALLEQDHHRVLLPEDILSMRRIRAQELRPPQPDVLTATGRTSGVEAGRSKARRDWSCARKKYRSTYLPLDDSDDASEGDRVSETFKRSNFDYMIVTNSHGGLTDTGINEIVRRPLFQTQHNVIFPVRCGMLLEIQRLPEPLDELAENLPMTPSEFTGQSLVDALHDCEFTRGISQYDIGASVPNLEIFTRGTYRGHRKDPTDCHAIDDDVLLYDAVKHTFRSLKYYMGKLVDEVKPVVDVTHVTHVTHPRPRRSKKNTKNKVKPTITKLKLVENLVPFYSLSKTHKFTHNHPDDTPLTLADLCENRGLIEKLVTMLKKDGSIDAKAEASNIPVLVLACRCIPGNDNRSFPLGSPTSSNYFTDVGSQNSSSSMLCDLDDVTGQNARCGAVGACSVGVPDDESDGPSIDEDVFDQGQGVFWQDQELDGGRNATKKRRKRPNATKKRRKRRNATKKRRKRRS